MMKETKYRTRNLRAQMLHITRRHRVRNECGSSTRGIFNNRAVHFFHSKFFQRLHYPLLVTGEVLVYTSSDTHRALFTRLSHMGEHSIQTRSHQPCGARHNGIHNGVDEFPIITGAVLDIKGMKDPFDLRIVAAVVQQNTSTEGGIKCHGFREQAV